MKDLQFGTDIDAPVARVWDCMFDPIAYRDWTRAFAEGSYYEGVWAAGRRLRFLDPQGFGMEAIVDECMLHERLSLRLVGEIRDGKPVAGSRLHREPAHERYIFDAAPGGGTQLVVHLQSWDDGFTDFLNDSWPKALRRLKALAESTH
ncbi:MAG: SRPBCC domain-containing protein [Burkholderiales bacterium]|nr:SRPBCC domain-containing protein [Burkholderiales bacterium]